MRFVVLLVLSAAVCGGAAMPAPRDTRVWFDPLAVPDGLSGEEIGQILQDRTGFLWFQTSTGLARYDGYEIVRYRDVPRVRVDSVSANSMPGFLYQDRLGRFWICAQVLAGFDPASGRIAPFEPPAGRAPPRILSVDREISFTRSTPFTTMPPAISGWE